MSFTQCINPNDEGKLARNHGIGTYLATDRTKLLKKTLRLLYLQKYGF